MCNEPKAFEQLCELMDKYEALRPTPPAAQPAPVQEPVVWPRPEDQPIDNGPDYEDGPDEEGFSGPRPWNGFAQPAPVQEPVDSAAKGAIMGAAYDFRDAHISGSTNLKRSAHAALENAVDAALKATPPAAQPAVPDALNPKNENPAYAAGWNDCRAEMLKGMK